MTADIKKVYLGDSVYAEFDGFHIVLTTENSLPSDPSNIIALDPDVQIALVRFIENRLMAKLYEHLNQIRALASKQAEDEGLWFEAQTAPEAYLQKALRELAAAIEGEKYDR